MAILELKAARNWSLEQTAEAFLVTAATIASWLKRVDEKCPASLVQLSQPVNKFPEFVCQAVRRLKTLCPSMGKVKIAQVLARAGLHLGATTVGRVLKGGRGPPGRLLRGQERRSGARRPGGTPPARRLVASVTASPTARSIPLRIERLGHDDVIAPLHVLDGLETLASLDHRA